MSIPLFLVVSPPLMRWLHTHTHTRTPLFSLSQLSLCLAYSVQPLRVTAGELRATVLQPPSPKSTSQTHSSSASPTTQPASPLLLPPSRLRRRCRREFRPATPLPTTPIQFNNLFIHPPLFTN